MTDSGSILQADPIGSANLRDEGREKSSRMGRQEDVRRASSLGPAKANFI